VLQRIDMHEMANQSDKETDDNRFVAMLTTSQPNLRAFVLSMTPSQGDADDLLQEANMALWAKRHRYFDLNIEFIRWALGFVTLEILKHRRRAANSQLWLGEEVIEKLAAEWHQNEHFTDDCHVALQECISKLPHAQRSVIEDRYIRMHTTKQIAIKSGRPLSTIYKIVNRALLSLRECVERSNRRLDH
jgi:RNA polymerase sigma-70 factor